MYVRDGISILDENQLERILINTILIDPKGKININNLKDNEYIFGLLTCLCMIYLRKNKLSQIENYGQIGNFLDYGKGNKECVYIRNTQENNYIQEVIKNFDLLIEKMKEESTGRKRC